MSNFQLPADANTVDDCAVRDGRDNNGSHDWGNGDWPTHRYRTIRPGTSRPNNACRTHDGIGIRGVDGQSCDENRGSGQDQK
jgi:hypothetical protein